MFPFDSIAPTFDRHRALPDGVAEAIRAQVLAAIGGVRPRLLDLGAGTGRIGHAFVAAGDDYVGLDLSPGMLGEFARREDGGGAPRLVQADGRLLPFADAAFDAVLLVQIFGGMRDWRQVLAEARRVLRPAGALVLGRTVAPEDGVDARMKERLAALLAELGAPPRDGNARADAQRFLEANVRAQTRAIAAAWSVARTPRQFVDRHRSGARFSALPVPVKEEALRKLEAWAHAAFGSLDVTFSEQHAFELRVFRFDGEEF